VRLAVAAWVLLVAAVCVRSLVQPRQRTLFTTWSQAGRDWVAGLPLYRTNWEPHQDQFRYSPLVAVLLVPWGPMPEGPGGALWRLLNATVLLGGLAWWLRVGLPRPPSARGRAVVFLLALPLSLGSLNNGQPNPLITGLLLVTAAAAARGRWNLAAAAVVLATAWKVYPLAVGLLLAAAYPRRFAPRLALALLVGLSLPFLCQRFDYVGGQYRWWLERLGGDDRKGWPPFMAYRDLWQLLRVWGVPMTPRAYLLLQGALAAAAALLCVAGRRRGWGRPRVALAALALGCCWMTLVGPATESATYVMLAPVLAWAALDATDYPWRGWGLKEAAPQWPAAVRWLPAAAWWLFLQTVLAGLFPGVTGPADAERHPLAVIADALRHGHAPPTNQVHALGLHALAALLLTVACAVAMLRALAASAPGASAAGGSPPPARAA
jgi:hypothetical protein